MNGIDGDAHDGTPVRVHIFDNHHDLQSVDLVVVIKRHDLSITSSPFLTEVSDDWKSGISQQAGYFNMEKK